MTRITAEQITSAEQYFKDGFSIPECCQMANMSRASFNKYCRRVVETYISEHEQAKARREIIPDDSTSIKDLSLDEFTSYVTHEFNNTINDIIAIKDLFYQLKNDSELNYEQVLKLRELYEARLNQLTSKKTIQQSIKDFKIKYQIKIPIPRAANDWDEMRLLEHLVFWYVVSTGTRAIAFSKLKELDTLDKRKEWLEQQD